VALSTPAVVSTAPDLYDTIYDTTRYVDMRPKADGCMEPKNRKTMKKTKNKN